MRKIIILYCFVVVAIMTLVGFLGATSFSQLISAILFFPLLVYFTRLLVPRSGKVLIIPLTEEQKHYIRDGENEHDEKQQIIKPTKLNEKEEFDLDKRKFLKLIGSAGMTVFLFSIFTKKAEAAFFGSVPGPGTVAVKDSTGALIDPAIKTPTDGYKITDIDDSTPAYYGFMDKTSAWFIMKEDSSGAYRYTKGSSSFSTNWTNRASLTYDYFDAIF